MATDTVNEFLMRCRTDDPDDFYLDLTITPGSTQPAALDYIFVKLAEDLSITSLDQISSMHSFQNSRNTVTKPSGQAQAIHWRLYEVEGSGSAAKVAIESQPKGRRIEIQTSYIMKDGGRMGVALAGERNVAVLMKDNVRVGEVALCPSVEKFVRPVCAFEIAVLGCQGMPSSPFSTRISSRGTAQ